ncbi:MAG: LacI family DNA-binding transcriptional regulator [Anaerolineae bacterium]|nr:LacI family DNA-binding transcriptional regulator [Anaerolineae bacterium]
MATIYDVAEKAGVSVGTVSRYLNGSGYVGRKSADRIAAAIEELGYSPNRNARSLTTKRSGMIGFVVSDLANPFTAEIARGVQDTADEFGYCALIYNTDGNAHRELRALNTLREHQVDGIIITPPEIPEGNAFLAELIAQGIPVVLLGRDMEPLVTDFVSTDTYLGAVIAVDHLLELGHNRIACICARNAAFSRRRGYMDALTQAGLDVDERLIVETELTRQGGVDAMTQLLKLEDPPSAVFAVNDVTALGAMHHAIRRGVSIPGDISFVGFDDIVLAEYAQPALTSVAQPKLQLGRTAFELLHTRLETSDPIEPRRVILPCELVRRESTAVARTVTSRLQRSSSDE